MYTKNVYTHDLPPLKRAARSDAADAADAADAPRRGLKADDPAAANGTDGARKGE